MIVHEQLSFQDALSLATKRIFETKGRSRRSEFWWAMLVAYFISNFLPPFWLVTIPISIRRLHDTGRSGWWMFFPVVATIIIVSMCVSDVLSFMTMDDFEDTITPFVVFGKYIFFCGIVSVYQIVMIIFFARTVRRVKIATERRRNMRKSLHVSLRKKEKNNALWISSRSGNTLCLCLV